MRVTGRGTGPTHTSRKQKNIKLGSTVDGQPRGHSTEQKQVRVHILSSGGQQPRALLRNYHPDAFKPLAGCLANKQTNKQNKKLPSGLQRPHECAGVQARDFNSKSLKEKDARFKSIETDTRGAHRKNTETSGKKSAWEECQ